MTQVLDVPVIAGRAPDQIAFLVPDFDSSLEEWSRLRPEGEWLVYRYGPSFMDEPTYRGEDGRFEMLLGLQGSGPQIEIIQPLSGPSIYHDWIGEHGHGFHHLGYFVRSLTEAMEQFAEAGKEVLQSGRGYGLDGDGGFAYYDYSAELGAHIEVIEVPRRRRPSLALDDR